MGENGRLGTPNDQFFTVAHYNKLAVDPATWQLQITGLVGQPLALTLDALEARPRQEVTFTVECSGNNELPFSGVVSATPIGPGRLWRRCSEKRGYWTRVLKSFSWAPARVWRTSVTSRCHSTSHAVWRWRMHWIRATSSATR
jgi:DMSO/TMAO reductase YedYZ molybdopterin-dependent catalytic subunit